MAATVPYTAQTYLVTATLAQDDLPGKRSGDLIFLCDFLKQENSLLSDRFLEVRATRYGRDIAVTRGFKAKRLILIHPGLHQPIYMRYIAGGYGPDAIMQIDSSIVVDNSQYLYGESRLDSRDTLAGKYFLLILHTGISDPRGLVQPWVIQSPL